MRPLSKNLFILILSGSMVALIPVSRAFDSTPPKLVSTSLSPTSLTDLGGSVTITLGIQSNSGVKPGYPWVQFLYVGEFRYTDATTLTRVSGDDKNGTYSGSLKFGPGLKPGVYQLFVSSVPDVSGNELLGSRVEAYVNYGTFSPTPTASPTPKRTPAPTVTATPAPAPTVTVTARPQPDSNIDAINLTVLLKKLTEQLEASKSEIKSLRLKLRKVCSARPKPKGC